MVVASVVFRVIHFGILEAAHQLGALAPQVFVETPIGRLVGWSPEVSPAVS